MVFFREKVGKRKINADAVAKYAVDIADMENLKQGKDIQLNNGEWIENHHLTLNLAYQNPMRL